MSGSAHVLKAGDHVRWDGRGMTVAEVSGTSAVLADVLGVRIEVLLVDLFQRGTLGDVGQRPRRLASGTLALLPDDVLKRARWWEGHIIEVLTGCLPKDESTAPAKTQYDPATQTLEAREAAKAAELAAAGHEGVSTRTIRRRRKAYEARGLEGLVDHRNDRARSLAGRTDERVVGALRRAIEEAVDESSRTATFLMWKTEQILAEEFGPGEVPMPSRSTFFRVFKQLSQGRHTTGSARTRRSMANQPRGPYGVYTLVRPGELVEIDSTPLDVAVRLADGVVGRVELTGMIDVATRGVTAAVLRPSTKSVDASLLLARTVTPELMRPGWVEALRMSRSVLPYRSMLSVDARLEHAAARPIIVPEVIVCDQGKAFISENFRSSCQQLGIDFQPAPPADPVKKPHIEKMMSSFGTLFSQYVAGYLGSSTDRRGYQVERNDPLWSLPELQELLDEWIVAGWQNRPHDGLRDPLAPARMFTPNEKYAALVEAAGYVPVALGAEDYIELLPADWRAVNHYGIKINHRVYDGPELDQLRRQHSGVDAKRGLWEIHHDPYDVSRIWLRHHWNGGWITLFWKHLRGSPAPFGELAWDHELAQVREAGGDPNEREIAQAVGDLLARAHQGPEGTAGAGAPKPTKRDKRVAARTAAVGPSLPTDVVPIARPAQPAEPEPLEEEEDGELAEVVPLGVFDARKEAQKWW